MQRTTIMLPLELKNRAAKHCEQKGMSLGRVIREALEKEINRQEMKDHSIDCFFEDKAVYQGDAPDDLSARHDEYLYRENS